MTYLRQYYNGYKMVTAEVVDKPKVMSDGDEIKIEEIKSGLSVIQVETLRALDVNEWPGLLFALRGYGNDDMYDKSGWLKTIQVLLNEIKLKSSE